ncbi:hypothetical protein [Corynebacterium nasicanis]|uniref:DUF308 domain-containing protein n=1 Tax=Corynebacterium nasicanis TaxID=1448267 RepID=A0ABW1QEX7_9CORY
MTPRTLLLTGLLFQIAVIALYVLASLSLAGRGNPWVVAGAAGIVGSVICLVGAIRGREKRAPFILGVLGALLSGIAWGSWVVVGLTSELGDPVINITGLLVVPGLVLGFIAWVLTSARPVERSGALWFGLAYVVLIGVEMALLFSGAEQSYLLITLLFFALAAWQVGRTHLSPAEPARLSRTLSLVGGYLVLLTSVSLLMGPMFVLLWVGVGLTLWAGVAERRYS